MSSSSPSPFSELKRPAVIATWAFAEGGTRAAAAILSPQQDEAYQGPDQDQDLSLEAVVRGLEEAERDESITSIGYGGLPNERGELELDAAIMKGNGMSGSVLGLQGYKTSIHVARLILEHSRHPVLTGHGARIFAESFGIKAVKKREQLLTSHATKRYQEYLSQQQQQQREGDRDSSASRRTNIDGDVDGIKSQDMSHTDTVGIICLDTKGRITVGCATSGMQFKQVGRIGDCPLIGCGLYADDQVGAASASGDGDQMIRFCLSFLIVEKMRDGMTPQQACDYAINRVAQGDPRCQAAVIAMDKQGNTGASCTRNGFTYCTFDPSAGVQVHYFEPSSSRDKWKHTCV